LNLLEDGILNVNNPYDELAQGVRLTVSDVDTILKEQRPPQFNVKTLNGPPQNINAPTHTGLIAKDDGEKHNPTLTINLKSDRTVLIKFPKNVQLEDIDRTIKFLEFYKEGL
jgi:hypothetical protein